MELAQQKICDLTEKKEFKSCNKDHDDGHNGDEYEDIIVPINELDADEWEWWTVSMRKNVDDMVGLGTGDLCPDWGGGLGCQILICPASINAHPEEELTNCDEIITMTMISKGAN